MNKNFKNDAMKELMDEHIKGEVQMPFAEYMEGLDTFFTMMEQSVALVNLIREEETLKKHHRAYLHVRDKITRCADETMDFICDLVEKMEKQYAIASVEVSKEKETKDTDTVTLSKDEYDLMVEDLLTMAELIDMVCSMRSKDVRAIHEFSKFVPAFASYEKSRLSVYRDAAKEAKDIITRWEDELLDDDEDYEPDEYFSD
jgi:hypothetical protein